MEQKLSDTLVKAIDRSNPMMQNLQLASRFNKLIEQGGGSDGEYGKYLVLDIEATPIYDTTPPNIKHYNVVVDFSKYPNTYIQLPFNNKYLYPIEQLERVLQNEYLDKDGNVIGSGYQVYDGDSQVATFVYLPAEKRVTKIVSYIENKSSKLYEINVSYPD